MSTDEGMPIAAACGVGLGIVLSVALMVHDHLAERDIVAILVISFLLIAPVAGVVVLAVWKENWRNREHLEGTPRMVALQLVRSQGEIRAPGDGATCNHGDGTET